MQIFTNPASLLSTLLAACAAVPPKPRLRGKVGVLLASLFVALGLWTVPANAQHQVTGEVTDAEQGGGLPGVNIVVKGTQIGTVTQSNGTYSIEAPSPTDTLVYRFVGYQTQEIPINNRSEINVALEEAVTAMEEVVVQVGYQEQAMATTTGSVSQVSGEDLEIEPSTNLSSTLQGTIPGIIATSRGGIPGQDGSNLLIRGSSTLNNNSPLIVIDGVPGRQGGLDRLNPSNIESISVLKDASAAIYGSRAANGVILVETKRGRAGETRINVNVEQGWSQPTRLLEMVNAPEQMQMLNELEQYRGNPQRFTQEEIDAHRGDQSDSWDRHNTDWYDVALQDWSQQTTADASIMGGSESVQYRVGLNASTEGGIMRQSFTRYNQVGFRSNLDGDVTENVHVAFDLHGRYEDRRYPGAVDHSSLFNRTQQLSPLVPAFWPNGDPAPGLERGINPAYVGSDVTGFDERDTYYFQSNLSLDVDIPAVDGWSAEATATYDRNVYRRKNFIKPWTLYARDGSNEATTPVTGPNFTDPRLREERDLGREIMLRGTSTYERAFGDHNVNLLLGTEWQGGESNELRTFRRFFPTEQLSELFAGGTNQQSMFGNSSQSARLNFFGRANYNYQETYLLEFVGRYDGSYIFPEGNRFGFFPSLSAGWRLAQESWFNNLTADTFDRLKIRASYGLLGNDQIGPYQFLRTYRPSGLFAFGDGIANRLQQTREPNPEITWEVSTKFDLGLQGAILNERLSFDLTYFRQFREDILWFRSGAVPRITGFNLPRENIGEVRSQGFDGQVSYTQNLTSEASLRFGVNWTYAKDEIVFFDEPEGQIPYQANEGKPMNTRLFYIDQGIWHTQDEIDNNPSFPGARPGDIRYKDVNGDGQINSDDRKRLNENTQPDLIGSFNLGATVGPLDARFQFQGAAQVRRDISTGRVGDRGPYYKKHYENRWHPDNKQGTWPRAWNRNEPYWVEEGTSPSTFFFRDAKYLRLKSARLTYTLPSILSPGEDGQYQVYVSGRNLVTWSPLEIVDPEMSKGGDYPPERVYTVGIQASF